MLSNVTTLSDDEPSHEIVPASAPACALNLEDAVCRERPCRKRKLSPEELRLAERDIKKNVQTVVFSTCRCSRKGRKATKTNCFQPFRESDKLEQICKLRSTLRSMHKADADQTAN